MLKLFIYILFFAVVLQNAIGQWPIPGGSFVDEIATITIFGLGESLFLWKFRRLSKPAVVAIGVWSYATLISITLGQNRDLFSILIQTFISTKFFFVASGMYGIWAYRDIRFGKLVNWLAAITLTGMGVQAVIGDRMFHVLHLSANQFSTIGDGSMRLSGLLLNPNAAGAILGLAAVCLWIHLAYSDNRKAINYALIALCTAGILATGSRSAMLIEMMAVLFTVRLRNVRSQILFVVGLLGLAVFSQTELFSLLYNKTLENIAAVQSGGDDNYPRWLMAYFGVFLAYLHFPIGTGAGTFGSVMSKGDVIYSHLGLMQYQSIANGSGIFDSNFGSIAGEYGVIGVVLFYGSMFYILRCFVHASWISGDRSRLVRLGLMFGILGVMMTFFRPLFSSSYYGGLFSLSLISCVRIISNSSGVSKFGNDQPMSKRV